MPLSASFTCLYLSRPDNSRNGCLGLFVLLLALGHSTELKADNLYIGNNVTRYASSGRLIDVTSSVLRFDADTGEFMDTFVAAGSGNAFGLRGILFNRVGDLIAVDQNIGQPTNGEILTYSGSNGSFLGNLVAEPNAPYAPRGAILSPNRESLYVADMGDFGPNCESLAGDIYRYDAATGAFQDILSATIELGDFHPRGLVFGPDGLLYASDFGNPCNPRSGSVLRFNAETGAFVDEFVAAVSGDLHWPEGLTFGPDGDLYAISGRSGPDDVGQIQRFDGASGELVESINLSDAADDLSATAQALLFGPNGALYVPIENRRLDDLRVGVENVVSGELRRYNVEDGSFETLVAATGQLKSPWFLTFENTDPSTFAYLSVAIIPGDFNSSGSLDENDIEMLSQQVLAGSQDVRFDLTGDQTVDHADRVTWVHQLKKTYFGDANLDGEFNSSDLTKIFQQGEYEDAVVGNSTWASGDWNGDSEFNTSDLVAAFQDGGYEQGPMAKPAVVPEPSAAALHCVAIAVLLIGRRLR